MADPRSMQRSPPPIPRRRSHRQSDPNIFSDEYALESFDISEPFTAGDAEPSRRRHSTRTPSSARRSSQTSLNAECSNDLPYHNQGHRPTSPASGHSQSTLHHTHSLHREPSDASATPILRAQSPYRGPTGPSHPYANYSQKQDKSISRVPSNATVSTARSPLQNYSGPSGPSQPYGMYAQNTVSEEDLVTEHIHTRNVADASTGPSQTYQRRQGPDGDGADDLIGPDGHTEQLPPYTQYPNDLPPKERIVIPERDTTAEATLLEVSQENLNTNPTSPAASTNLAYQGANTQTTPEHAPQIQDSAEARDFTQAIPPQSVTSPSADEGGHFKEVVAAKSKKRVCGLVPPWLLIILAVVVFLIVVIGGSVGGVLRHKELQREVAAAKTSQPPTETVTVTSIIDAEPVMTTPVGFPTLPTGTFFVPLKSPVVKDNTCLSNAAQNASWACTDGPRIRIKIKPKSTGPSLLYIESDLPPNEIRYGAQPPQLSYPADVMIMTDKDDRAKGTSYFFQELYNKVVVVRENEFNRNAKRWLDEDFQSAEHPEASKRGLARSNTAQPYDRPWYCFWNNTILEGFIYAYQDSNHNIKTSSAPLSAMSMTYSSTSGSGTRPSAVSSPFTASGFHSSSGAEERKRSQIDVVPFPKMVKFEERRAPNSPPPYCRQMQILINKQAAPVQDSSDVVLEESEPMQQSRVMYHPNSNYQPRRALSEVSSESMVNARSLSGCKCEWQYG